MKQIFNFLSKNLLIFSLVVLVFLLILSFRWLQYLPDEHCLKYLYLPLKDGLNIVIVVIGIYYFVEHKNDDRATKKYLETIANRVITRVENERMYYINDEADINYIRVQQRIIKNELDLLKQCAETYGYEKEITHSKEKFNEYWDSISEEITNLEKLKNMDNILRNNVTMLINDMETISLKLYKQ